MDNLSSLLQIDPKKFQFDSNIKVTQQHIDQLFAGVGAINDKYEQDNPLTCDAECKANQAQDAAYEKYLSAKQNLENAPAELETAENNYYMISPEGQSHAAKKEAEAKKEVEEITLQLSNNFDDKVKELQERINSLKAESVASKYMKELAESYGQDIYQINSEITRFTNKKNINDRLAVYYNRDIDTYVGYLHYLRITYWVLVTIFIVFFVISQRFYRFKKYLVISLLLIVFPFILKAIIIWVKPANNYIPPPQPLCPTKPIKPVSPVPVSPPVKKPTPAPPSKLPASTITNFTPTNVCPKPTLWSTLQNSFPSMTSSIIPRILGKAKLGAYNMEHDIASTTSRWYNKIKNIV